MPREPSTEREILEPLCRLFYESVSELGGFTEVAPESMPAVYRALLAHEHHMTVTVERHHADSVDVRVLDKVLADHHYARRILLAKHSDGKVVQFGIMRVDLNQLDSGTREEILAQTTPLGRILINHNVHRQVHLAALWRVEPAGQLQKWLGMAPGQVTYGRTAIIECNGEPAIELIEIVAPDDTSQDAAP